MLKYIYSFSALRYVNCSYSLFPVSFVFHHTAIGLHCRAKVLQPDSRIRKALCSLSLEVKRDSFSPPSAIYDILFGNLLTFYIFLFNKTNLYILNLYIRLLNSCGIHTSWYKILKNEIKGRLKYFLIFSFSLSL